MIIHKCVWRYTWYSLTLDYTKAKWKFASPNQRRSIAEALTDATEVLFTTEAPYPRAEIRRALVTWAYSARLRGDAKPPKDIAPIVKWLEIATIPVAALAEVDTHGIHARAILNRLNSKQDDTRAAPNTANRKRAVLNNLVRLAGSVLLDIHDEWQAAERRYFSESSMAKLSAERDNETGSLAELEVAGRLH